MFETLVRHYSQALDKADLFQRVGRVVDFNGLVVEAVGPDVALGELCEIRKDRRGDDPIRAEVVALKNGRIVLMPYGHPQGISLRSEFVPTGHMLDVPVGDALLGRVVNAFCQPLDGKPMPELPMRFPLHPDPINPLERAPIDQVMETGIKAIDTLFTLGKGQRIGVFSGSGVGKSTLLGMLARNIQVDVNVIALIGERGREVWDFIRTSLGDEGLARSVVVVATADETAIVRCHAVHVATAISEYFRANGRDVALIMDSVTRFAMARREIGLAAGEPPAMRGYTPSVFSLLPQLLERGGNLVGKGSITGIYSVLVEGDDVNEPVADHMRATLDGHLWLSRDLASRGHYPAIDVGHSISRLMPGLATSEERELARDAVALLSRVDASRDLIEMGAYQAGTNPELDRALTRLPDIESVLRQSEKQSVSREEALRALTSACRGGREDSDG